MSSTSAWNAGSDTTSSSLVKIAITSIDRLPKASRSLVSSCADSDDGIVEPAGRQLVLEADAGEQRRGGDAEPHQQYDDGPPDDDASPSLDHSQHLS